MGSPLAHCVTRAQFSQQHSAGLLRTLPDDCGLLTNGFELAFIDGDPRLENVLDDLISLERYAAPGALAVLRNTLPVTELSAPPPAAITFLHRR